LRIEIRASGGPACEHCGSYPLIHLPQENRHLEADLLALFEADAPKHRLFKRAAYRRLRREVQRVTADLRDATRKAA
jgi:hypothetical protein